MTRAERAELEALRRLVLDVDDTALRAGRSWGLCDCTSNSGEPYQSAWAEAIIQRIRAEVDARAATDRSGVRAEGGRDGG